ncbi:MAG: PIN domain-containing protein [Deltaproteobacteria bacterium]
MKKLYLDMNIYNRPFDDQSQVRIKLETIAINAILKMIKSGKFALLWSFMVEFENSLNPYDDVRTEIDMLSKIASEYVNMSDDILEAAKEMESVRIKPRDAVHLACAIKAKADWFLTCDDKLIRKARFIKDDIIITNPLDFVRSEVR